MKSCECSGCEADRLRREEQEEKDIWDETTNSDVETDSHHDREFWSKDPSPHFITIKAERRVVCGFCGEDCYRWIPGSDVTSNWFCMECDKEEIDELLNLLRDPKDSSILIGASRSTPRWSTPSKSSLSSWTAEPRNG